MLEELESLWNGHLWFIKAVKNRIELKTDHTAPIHSALYRAFPSAQGFEKDDISKIVAQGDIGPAQTEWASPIVFD